MIPNFYDISIKALTRWNVPRSKRLPKRMARLYAMVSAASEVFQQLLRYRKAKQYQLMITPQVCYLERLLNDRYDFTERRIHIVDGVDKPPTYFFRRDELKPVYFFKRSENKPIYLYTRGESGALTDDFVVLVPAAIAFEEAEMRSLVTAYKLAGTIFKIQRV